MGITEIPGQFFQAIDFQRAANKRRKTRHDDSPQLEDLTSQYSILLSLAKHLSVGDLLNLGLVSQTSWSILSSHEKPLRLRKGLAKHALRCSGLQIQTRPQSPHQGTPYVLPCTSNQVAPVRPCKGCGVGLCESCRFRPTHGAMLTYTHKRRWFFPSRSQSRPDVVTTNLETMFDSMIRRGKLRRDSSAPLVADEAPCQDPNHFTEKSCDCDVETRWLDNWLCVPCFNNDIFSAPTHEAYYARRPSMAVACQQGSDVGTGSTNHGTSGSPAPRAKHSKNKSIDQCNLCDKRLRYFDSARKGRCLPFTEDSERRKQLRYMAKALQYRRELPAEGIVVDVKAATAKRSRRASFPRTRYFKKPALPERRTEARQERRGSETVIAF